MKKMVLILLFFLALSLLALRVDEPLRPCLVDELLRLCLVDELRLPERSPRLLFLLLYILFTLQAWHPPVSRLQRHQRV